MSRNYFCIRHLLCCFLILFFSGEIIKGEDESWYVSDIRISEIKKVAQELEKIAPELVNDDSEYKAVAYGNITGYLIEAIKELKAGTIDIIIGTHALLQKDIGFKSLGLLIIDEEHRFGVRQKEKIKVLRENVNVLHLSATPIPRSLHFALSELKDFSIIATPPSNRLSVKTFVHSFSENLVKECIQRELLRDGQIYYLCNDLRLIESRKQRIEGLFPKKRIEIIVATTCLLYTSDAADE